MSGASLGMSRTSAMLIGARVTAVDSLLPDYGGNLFNLDGYEDKVDAADTFALAIEEVDRDLDEEVEVVTEPT